MRMPAAVRRPGGCERSLMRRPLSQQIELILSLARRDLKARYKESVLGFFWSLLRPAFLTLVLWVVFALILRLRLHTDEVPYWLHVLVSVLTWNFFLGSVTDATHSIVANGNLLKKVPLNAQVFPVAAVISNGVHYVLALGLALLVTAATVGLSPALLMLPVMVTLTALLALAVGMLLGALNVFYRDTGSALELAGLAWFYATPVIYPATVALQSLAPWGRAAEALYLANPATPLLIGVRRAMLYGPGSAEVPDAWLAVGLAGVTALTAALLGIGWAVYRKVGGDFADEL